MRWKKIPSQYPERLLVGFVGLFLLICEAASPEFDYGWALLQNLRFDEAKIEFEKAEKKGDPNGAFGLGVIHHHGHGATPQNYQLAIKYYRIAAAKGNLPAMHNLGYVYQHGIGVERDLEQAIRWYSEAADGGLELSQHDLGHMYLNGIGVRKNTVKAFKLFSSAKKRVPDSLHTLGIMLFEGIGTKKDEVAACAHVEAAWRAGLDNKERKIYCSTYRLTKSQREAAFEDAAQLVSQMERYHGNANLDYVFD